MSGGGGDGDGDGDEIVYEFADMSFNGPNLDVPGPPAGLPYEEHADHHSIQLLIANDVATTEDGIAEALRTRSGVMLAAAAHSAGSLAYASTVSALRDLARGPDDVAAAEAAYALARLGDDGGEAALTEAVSLPLGPSLGPVLAAGFLAQLGEPVGLPLVRAALDSEFLATRMLAAKQLYFFAVGGAARPLDELFGPALGHPDPAVQRQSLAELGFLGSPSSRPLLEQYVATTDDEQLRDLAHGILCSLP